jgi:hypothetical protein
LTVKQPFYNRPHVPNKVSPPLFYVRGIPIVYAVNFGRRRLQSLRATVFGGGTGRNPRRVETGSGGQAYKEVLRQSHAGALNKRNVCFKNSRFYDSNPIVFF